MPVLVGKAVPDGLQEVRWIREEEHVPTLLGVCFVHQLFASLWSMQSKQLAVGCQSITRQAEHTKLIPLETPNCFPEDVEHLVPLETTTRKLSVGELQPTLLPSAQAWTWPMAAWYKTCHSPACVQMQKDGYSPHQGLQTRSKPLKIIYIKSIIIYG